MLHLETSTITRTRYLDYSQHEKLNIYSLSGCRVPNPTGSCSCPERMNIRENHVYMCVCVYVCMIVCVYVCSCAVLSHFVVVWLLM